MAKPEANSVVAMDCDPFHELRPTLQNEDKMENLKALGQAAKQPNSPEEAELERVPNPHPDCNFVARFTQPEFTSLCPVTAQPDFAHLVIDYVPDQWMVESKSLKAISWQLSQPSGFS